MLFAFFASTALGRCVRDYSPMRSSLVGVKNVVIYKFIFMLACVTDEFFYMFLLIFSGIIFKKLLVSCTPPPRRVRR